MTVDFIVHKISACVTDRGRQFGTRERIRSNRTRARIMPFHAAPVTGRFGRRSRQSGTGGKPKSFIP